MFRRGQAASASICACLLRTLASSWKSQVPLEFSLSWKHAMSSGPKDVKLCACVAFGIRDRISAARYQAHFGSC